jgi:predicted lipid-binding transport protein (Tim44 family)
MEQKTETEAEAKARAKAKAKAKSKRDRIFGAIVAALIIGLIYMMFMIEDYGQRTMPGANVSAPGAPDDH